MLETYREQSRQVLKDVSMGIADGTGRAFNITPWEVEATEEFMWESRAGLPLAAADYADRINILRNSGLYKWAATMGGGRLDTCFLISCPFEQNFLLISSETTTIWNTHDITAMMGGFKMLITLLFAGCVAEGDRRACFELTIDCLFSKGHKTCSRLIKALDREGQIRVYLFTCRSCFCSELGADVMITCIERAPRSNYVVEHPEHPHRVVNHLRLKQSMAAPTHTSSSTSPASPSRSVPEPPMPPPPSYYPGVARNDEQEEEKEVSPPSAPWLEGKVAAALRGSLFGGCNGGGGKGKSGDQVEEKQQQQQQQQQQQYGALPGFAYLPAPPDSELLLRCVARAERKDGEVEEEDKIFREFKILECPPRTCPSSLSSSSSSSSSSSFSMSSTSSSSSSSPSLASSRRPLLPSRMDLKEEVDSEEEDAGGDGGGSSSSSSSSSSMNQYIASIKEEEEEKGNRILPGMDPLLLSVWAGDEVPVFDQSQLDLIFFQGTQR